MWKKIEMELPDEQAGFRPGSGTADMLVIIQVLIEQVMGIEGQALVTFINYGKALLDSISHVQLCDIMLRLGFPEHIVTLLQSLYIDQTASLYNFKQRITKSNNYIVNHVYHFTRATSKICQNSDRILVYCVWYCNNVYMSYTPIAIMYFYF